MRTRLLIALMGIAAVALAAFAIPLAFAESTRIHSDVDAELRRDVNRVSFFVPSGFASDRATFRLPLDDPDLTAAVYDIRGLRVSGSGPATGDRLITTALAGGSSCGSIGDDRACAQPIVEGEAVVGAVRASEPLSTARDRVRSRLLALAAGGLAVLGMAVLGALAGARRLSRPVAELRNAAVRLGGGDYSVRLAKSGIAEMDETADALAHAAERIGREVDRERAFSADVSHQLRTPITSLRAALETEQLVPRADHRIIISEALVDVDRLEATVRDLLALTRDAPLDRQILDTESILEQVRKAWTPRFAAADRALQLSVATSIKDLVVLASRSAVEQILDVLLRNAEDHGAGTVSLSALKTPAGALALRVGDEGPGVVGDSGEIFLRRSSSAHGTGIGLALAATLAAAERGDLSLERIGPQPVFRLTLPSLELPEDAFRADRRAPYIS